MRDGLDRPQGKRSHPRIGTENPQLDGLVDQAHRQVSEHATEPLVGIGTDADGHSNRPRTRRVLILNHARMTTGPVRAVNRAAIASADCRRAATPLS